MRSVKLLLCIFAIWYLIVQDTNAKRFELPTDLIERYFNVSYTAVFENCGHCQLLVAQETLENTEQNTAERVIDELVKRARDPLMNEDQWRQDMDRFCLHDVALRTVFEAGMMYTMSCTPVLAARKQALDNFMRDYTPIFCAEVERLAKREAGLSLKLN